MSVCRNIQGFHGLRNVIELEDRRFHYFYNENFKHTAVSDSELEGAGLDHKLTEKVLKTFNFYVQHVGQLTDTNKIRLLVQNKSQYAHRLPSEMGRFVMDVNDFVVENRQRFPELDNFLGFAEDDLNPTDDDVEMVEPGQLGGAFGFRHYHELPELLLGVKEGRYF